MYHVLIFYLRKCHFRSCIFSACQHAGFRCFFLFLILLVENINLFALPQKTDFRFDRFSTDNGLSTNQIHCVYQDHQGYIWLGTPIGLIRYNGYTFTTFKHNNNDTSSIGKGDVWSIYEDNQSHLWVGTMGGGLNLFNRENESFIHFYKQPETGVSINDNNVNTIIGDTYNNLWIGTGYGGLNCYNLKTGKFTYFKNNPNDSTSLGSNGVMSVYTDRQNMLWVGTWGGGLNLYNYHSKKFTRFRFDAIERPNQTSNVVWVIYEDTKNNFWLGTWGSGLQLFDRKTHVFKHYLLDVHDETSISDNVILTMTEDTFGNFWIGTESGGLNLMDRKKGTFSIPNLQGNEPNQNLYHSAIYSLINDRQGIIWIGTFGQGLNSWDKNKLKFPLWKLNDYFQGNIGNCALEDESGTIWIGTGENGILEYNKKLNIIKNLKKENDKLASKYVFSICNLNRNELLFSTYKGLYTINKKNETISKFVGKTQAVKTQVVNFKNQYIYYNKEGNCIVQYDISRNILKDLVTLDYTIVCFTVANDSTIWVGTDNNSIFLFSLKNHSLTPFGNSSNPKKMLSDNIVKCIYEDHMGTIWVGTYHGLNRINPKTHIIKVYEEKDGLDDAFISDITEDKSGNIWVSTNKGISCLKVKNESFTNFTEQDGLPDKTPTFCNTASGAIVMTGSKGFSIFNPAIITKNSFKAPVLITELKLFNKSGRSATNQSPLKRIIGETKRIVLKYPESSILSFSWVSLNYRLPEKSEYAYKMEGFENGWNFAGSSRSAIYTNLNPGDYIFRVKASNNDHVWNENEAILKITILPPFWKTWWFKVILLILITSLIYVWHLWRVRRLLNYKTVLQKMVIQRTEDINKQKEILVEQKEALQNQKEEISKQADYLQEANFLLSERGEELETATRELQYQSEELYKYNEELIRINSTKDRLFSIVGHDLRNPFYAITGFSQTLSNKFDKLEDKKKRQIIDNIFTSSVSASKLLENLLDWAHSQTNSIEIKPTDLNLKLIAERIVLLLSLQAASKKIKISIKINEQDTAYADLSMTETILRNLISNAIKFSHPEGEITIEVSEPKADILWLKNYVESFKDIKSISPAQFIEISVTDNGVGMPPEVLEKLFRIEVPHLTPGTSGERGSGLGLILCNEFVSKNLGKITAKSKVGKGSIFLLYLPKDKESAIELQKTKKAKGKFESKPQKFEFSEKKILDPEGEKYHILIVEDNPELRNRLVKDLSIGFHVHEAGDGKLGIEKAFQIIPDVIITDVMMPQIDGFELCKILKSDERTSHIPIIILTAKEDEEDQMMGLETGANDYLMKPFNVRLLKLKIRNLLETQQHLRERFVKNIFIGTSDLPINNIDEQFIKRAVSIVEMNIGDYTFNVETLAEKMNLSHVQLYRKFKAMTDLLPVDFIRSIRLKRAAQLLNQGILNVSEICFETGFNDPSYFTKCFKKEFGVLPTEYFQKHQ